MAGLTQQMEKLASLTTVGLHMVSGSPTTAAFNSNALAKQINEIDLSLKASLVFFSWGA